MFTVNHRNIQSLVIELLKVKENLSNAIMKYILQIRTFTYNLRSHTDFVSSFGLNLLRYYTLKVWNIVQLDIKNVSNLHIFKYKIRKCELTECYCDLCGRYVSDLGFFNLV